MTAAERRAATVLHAIGCIVILLFIALSFLLYLFLPVWSLERLLHACEELNLFVAHVLILFFRAATDKRVRFEQNWDPN